MALPKLLQKLFANDGVGPLLRSDIMPIKTVDGYAPDSNGNVDTERLPLSGGTMTGALKTASHICKDRDDSSLNIYGGTGYGKGAELVLSGKGASVNAGLAALIASDGSTTTELNCYPDGQLKWGTKEVERVASSGSNYVRYESGLQICWGANNKPAGATNVTVSLPVAFKDISSYFVVANVNADLAEFFVCVTKLSSTAFSVFSTHKTTGYNGTHTEYWLCVGWWK